MKKIALTLVAVSALGLAACGGTAANNAASDLSNTGNEAVADINNATTELRNETSNLTNAATSSLDEARDSVANVANATGSAVANETK